MAENDEIVYEFTPQFEGAFLRGVPARDLTQADFDRLDPMQQRDAVAFHPLYGTPLYTKAGESSEPPKWFQAIQEKAFKDGSGPPEPMLPNETHAQYEDRIAALAAASAPELPAEQDGDA